jgi:phage N-6-adenine-methyltransferase
MDQEALFDIQQEQKTSDDHYTPKWLFDKMAVEFDLDVASPPEGVAYIPTKKFYTQKDDGLNSKWIGFIWCNPPYSNVEPWVNKMIQHRNGIMLLPMVKSFWRLKVWQDADGICEPDGVDRIKFIHKGKEKEIMFPTFLAGWGTLALSALNRIGRVR